MAQSSTGVTERFASCWSASSISPDGREKQQTSGSSPQQQGQLSPEPVKGYLSAPRICASPAGTLRWKISPALQRRTLWGSCRQTYCRLSGKLGRTQIG